MAEPLSVTIQPLILEKLKGEPLTTEQIATNIGHNYHTVRNSLVLLQENGLIKTVDGRVRNKRFTLGSDGDITGKDSIPYVRSFDRAHKMNALLGLRKNKKPAAVDAINRLPMHVARILGLSIESSKNKDIEMTLDIVRKDMEKDLNRLRNAVRIYESIIYNPRNWTPSILRTYVKDHSFDHKELQETLDHFFASEDE